MVQPVLLPATGCDDICPAGTLDDWQTLCLRHQQEKKNLINDRTGRRNVRELVRNASKKIKSQVYADRKACFGDD